MVSLLTCTSFPLQDYSLLLGVHYRNRQTEEKAVNDFAGTHGDWHAPSFQFLMTVKSLHACWAAVCLVLSLWMLPLCFCTADLCYDEDFNSNFPRLCDRVSKLRLPDDAR